MQLGIGPPTGRKNPQCANRYNSLSSADARSVALETARVYPIPCHAHRSAHVGHQEDAVD